MKVDYVALDNALHKIIPPDDLDEATRAEYDAIASEGRPKRQKITATEAAAREFWAQCNAAEAANAPVIERLGEGSPELKKYFSELEQLRGNG